MAQQHQFRALTSLKGLFILIIALHNTLAITPLFSNIPGTAFIILFGGMLGNSMFFILSGFLLSWSYKNRIVSHQIGFWDFLIRRLKKLYPMYLISNLVAFVSEVLRYGASSIDFDRLIFTVLIKVGGLGQHSPYNKPTWFLCALLVCYVLFFAICHHAKHPTQYIFLLLGAVIVGYTLTPLELEIPYLSSGHGVAYTNFFLGCILAEIYPLISKNIHRWLQPALLIGLPASLLVMLAYGVELIAGDIKTVFAFMICPMILYLALVEGPCSRILQFKGFVFLGKISSCVFFWHLVLYLIFYEIFDEGAAMAEPQYLLYFLLMLAFSAVATGLEEKFLRKGSLSPQ